MGRRLAPPPSGRSSPTSTNASLLYFRKRTLGDKLQVLARVAPNHLRVIEQLVDQILKRRNGDVFGRRLPGVDPSIWRA